MKWEYMDATHTDSKSSLTLILTLTLKWH